MKCKCGGSILTQGKRVKKLIRGKIYYPYSYKCDQCGLDASKILVYIPTKWRQIND